MHFEPPKLKYVEGYNLLEEIGVGAFGRVYHAEKENSYQEDQVQDPSSQVAIKTVWIYNSRLLDLFTNEVAILKYLQSRIPHRINFESASLIPDRAEDDLYSRGIIVTKYIPGCTLKELTGLKLIQWLRIFRQLVIILREIHRCGIVHNDIKPENVRIHGIHDTRDIFLLDFGLARAINPTVPPPIKRHRPNAINGALMFMSPECIKGCNETPIASEIYSLGTTFYDVLMNHQAPYPGDTGRRYRANVLDPSVQLIPMTGIPSRITRLIYQMMDKNPYRRPSLNLIHQELDVMCSWRYRIYLKVYQYLR